MSCNDGPKVRLLEEVDTEEETRRSPEVHYRRFLRGGHRDE